MSTDKENGHALYTTRTQDIQDSHGKECCTGDVVVRGCCSWHATRKIKKKRNKKGISSDKERRMLA